ncbi:helix-turn-helix domain-containing protein [Nocardioides conyzicola]|uniref:LuxR C-terminal-related transcriptional regulator n=1 Tax=Nocardioides conyzicola TaxID=1651781 RepID=A0ABP8X800_9ACTN
MGDSGRAAADRWEPTADDVRILRLLSEGHTTDAVARRVGTSERTVRRRLRTIADEIGVDSTIEAVVYAVRSRLI